MNAGRVSPVSKPGSLLKTSRIDRCAAQTKPCTVCGRAFSRNPRHTNSRWAQSLYCSAACSGKDHQKHGQSAGKRTPEFVAWIGMIGRCYNPADKSYVYYGARGIVICPQWRDNFSAFFADMGKRPSPDHSLDRIDVNGNYEPSNCRWATRSEQQRNRRNNARIGTTLIMDLAEKVGVPVKRIRDRKYRGWSDVEAVDPINRQGKPRERNAQHLSLIRRLCCLACDADPSGEAAHVRIGTDGGMGLKPSDCFAVPLCHLCHMRQHRIGEIRFWMALALDPVRIADELYRASPSLEVMRAIIFAARERRK